ncbi:hypothetical protein AKG34_21385, partial [Peribacillus butanolivorans]|uniref:hypothetical protein n=1 Tax=Peribacillus butanolivorans TaxID=421767 RepID=UPI0006C12EB0
LFGLIYLGTAPFIIEDLVGMIEAPLLKVITLALYLNILASIPDTVDGMIGSSNTLGNQRFERGLDRMQFGSSGSFKKEFQGLNRHHRDSGGKSPISTVGSYSKQKAKGVIYGMRKR